ncbi:hypothetical protein BC835DRAFT_1309443 [Cytidiella melzeri]|nr:hypothetical protein BC835DRAFT_1309443 [Cytidiella melzeri]
MQSSRVPLELVKEVIGYLYDDIGTLHTTSLVSRACNDFTIPLLFCSICVNLSRPQNYLEELLRFLAASPHIRPFIKNLSLVRKSSNYREPTTHLDAHRLVVLLRHLPNLRALQVDSLTYSSLGEWPAVVEPFVLTTLSLRCITAPKSAYQGLLELLSVFSKIDHLHLANIPALPTPFRPDEHGLPTAGLEIEALTLERAWHPILPLCRDALKTRPKSFHMPYTGRESLPGLTEVFREYGSQLTGLSLDWLSVGIRREGPAYTPQWPAESLQKLTVLRDLTITVHLAPNDRHSWNLIPEFLDSLPRPTVTSLRYITIFIVPGHYKPHERPGWIWDAFDGVCQRFSMLERVELLWTADESSQRLSTSADNHGSRILWDDSGKAAVRGLLPQLESLQLLEFEERCRL